MANDRGAQRNVAGSSRANAGPPQPNVPVQHSNTDRGEGSSKPPKGPKKKKQKFKHPDPSKAPNAPKSSTPGSALHVPVQGSATDRGEGSSTAPPTYQKQEPRPSVQQKPSPVITTPSASGPSTSSTATPGPALTLKQKRREWELARKREEEEEEQEYQARLREEREEELRVKREERRKVVAIPHLRRTCEVYDSAAHALRDPTVVSPFFELPGEIQIMILSICPLRDLYNLMLSSRWFFDLLGQRKTSMKCIWTESLQVTVQHLSPKIFRINFEFPVGIPIFKFIRTMFGNICIVPGCHNKVLCTSRKNMTSDQYCGSCRQTGQYVIHEDVVKNRNPTIYRLFGDRLPHEEYYHNHSGGHRKGRHYFVRDLQELRAMLTRKYSNDAAGRMLDRKAAVIEQDRARIAPWADLFHERSFRRFSLWVKRIHGVYAAIVVPQIEVFFPMEEYWCDLPGSESERERFWPKLWPLMYARLKREVTGPWEIASNCPSERFGYPEEPSDEGYGYKHLVVKAREYIELGYIRHPTTAILYTQANPDAEYHHLTPPDPANLPTPDDLPIPDDLDYLLWE